MGNTITIPRNPQRIVSLVPSQTELLIDFGLKDRLVGITKFCIHPPELRKEIKVVGGTKNFHIDRIEALEPDLIIGNKEENEEGRIKALQEKYPVWMSDIQVLSEALTMILQLGVIMGKPEVAATMISTITKEFESLRFPRKRPKTLYFIWRKPWMAAGKDTFIDAMLRQSGFRNAVSQSRYPELTEEEILALAPEVVMLSSEPYPFKEKHMAELQAMLPNARIILVDGEMYSWYGSRLLQAPAYFKKLGEALFSES